jgi:hypothetical protein
MQNILVNTLINGKSFCFEGKLVDFNQAAFKGMLCFIDANLKSTTASE